MILLRKKKLQEELQAASGDIRGLGYVTGDPGNLDQDFITTWTQINAADADTRDNILQQMKKNTHDNYHINIDQKRADQKQNFISNVLKSIRDRSR